MKKSGELTVCGICLERLPIEAETGVRFILEDPVEAPKAFERTLEFEPGFLMWPVRRSIAGLKDNGS
jgi:hypothetical protein